MADNPWIVALLREYKDEATITRVEVGEIVDMSRGQIAGICNRNRITPWPLIPETVRHNRCCQFPLGEPDSENFRLCDKQRAPDHPFLCVEHKGKKWKYSCKVFPIARAKVPPVAGVPRLPAIEETPPSGAASHTKTEEPPFSTVPVCEWPMPDRTSLFKIEICGKTVEEGERFCKVHGALVRAYRRQV